MGPYPQPGEPVRAWGKGFRGTWWPVETLGDWGSPIFGKNLRLTAQPLVLQPIQLVWEDVPLSDLLLLLLLSRFSRVRLCVTP